MNTNGSYTCTCNTGYTGDGKECYGKHFPKLSFKIYAHGVREGLSLLEKNRYFVLVWLSMARLHGMTPRTAQKRYHPSSHNNM